MFEILIAIVLVATGEITTAHSTAVYPTREACETVRLQSMPPLFAELTEKVGPIKLASSCQIKGQDA